MSLRNPSPVTPRRAPISATRPILPTIEGSPDQSRAIHDSSFSNGLTSSTPKFSPSFMGVEDPSPSEQLTTPAEDYISRWSTDTNTPTGDRLDLTSISRIGGFAAALAKRRSNSNSKGKAKHASATIKRDSAESGKHSKKSFNSAGPPQRPPSELALQRSSGSSNTAANVRKSQIGEPTLMQREDQVLLSEMKGYESMALVSERTKDGVDVGSVRQRLQAEHSNAQQTRTTGSYSTQGIKGELFPPPTPSSAGGGLSPPPIPTRLTSSVSSHNWSRPSQKSSPPKPREASSVNRDSVFSKPLPSEPRTSISDSDVPTSLGKFNRDRQRKSRTSTARSQKPSVLSTEDDGSLAVKLKEEQVLKGSTLAGLYLVSGLPKDVSTWSLADQSVMKDAQPQTSEDSLGVFFRAEVLGRSWGNPSTDKRTPHSSSTAFGMQADRSDSLNSKSSFTSLHAPEGISPVLGKMMAKALKVAHRRDAEVILSPVAPASTTHISTFTLSVSGANAGDFGRANSSLFDSHSLRTMRNDRMSSQTTKWHAVTLTVWNSADRERAARLRRLKKKIDQSAQAHGAIDPDASALLMAAATGASQSTIHVNQSKHPNATPKAHSKRHPLRSFVSDTEEGGTDSDNIRHLHRGKYQRMSAAHDIDVGEAATGAFDQGEETFWIPYALTLVSKYPLYDLMRDHLKLAWARFSKDVKAHSIQMQRFLSYPAKRPGESITLLSGPDNQPDIELSTAMPGVFDVRRGLEHPNFQTWPLFCALRLDHLITCLEVSLLSSGKILFVSAYPDMIGQAVLNLKYLATLGGFEGIWIPMLHTRDSSFLLEHPGPFIVGIDVGNSAIIDLCTDVLVVDLDSDHLTVPSSLKQLTSLSPKGTAQREKMRKRLLTAFGADYQHVPAIPGEFKHAFPGGTVRPFCAVHVTSFRRLGFLGPESQAPRWWSPNEVFKAIDKIVTHRVQKPSFFQRLTGNHMPSEAKSSTGETRVRELMQQRALQYIEKRDDFEIKVTKISKRLIHLVQEGDRWKKQFAKFEEYAEKLGLEALELKKKIEAEKRESRRLSGILNEKASQNNVLQERLAKTEEAREVAMKQLSDMHQSIQDLERERDEIIDSIESQLTAVTLLHGMADRDSQGGSEMSLSEGRSPSGLRTHGKRDTIDSVDSVDAKALRKGTASPPPVSKSVFEAVGKTIQQSRRLSLKASGTNSYLGSTRRGAGGSVYSREMSDKMASIQAKLDIALQAVSAHKRTSWLVAEQIENENDDSAYENLDTVASARDFLQSSANVEDDTLEHLDDGGEKGEKTARDDGKDSDAKSAAATIVQTSNSKSGKVKGASKTAAQGEPPVPNLSLPQVRSNGEQTRLESTKDLRSDIMHPSAVVATVDETTTTSASKRPVGHRRQPSSSQSQPSQHQPSIIHRVKSNSMLATITAVIRMDGKSQSQTHSVSHSGGGISQRQHQRQPSHDHSSSTAAPEDVAPPLTATVTASEHDHTLSPPQIAPVRPEKLSSRHGSSAGRSRAVIAASRVSLLPAIEPEDLDALQDEAQGLNDGEHAHDHENEQTGGELDINGNGNGKGIYSDYPTASPASTLAASPSPSNTGRHRTTANHLRQSSQQSALDRDFALGGGKFPRQ